MGSRACAASAADVIVTPLANSVAAHAMTMNAAITFVTSVPRNTSARLDRRSSGRSPLSTTYDWMNPCPHGVIVVPTMPTTASQYAGDDDSCGRTSDWSAWPQSGCDAIAEKTYAPDTSTPITTNSSWTRRYDPSAMNA